MSTTIPTDGPCLDNERVNPQSPPPAMSGEEGNTGLGQLAKPPCGYYVALGVNAMGRVDVREIAKSYGWKRPDE